MSITVQQPSTAPARKRVVIRPQGSWLGVGIGELWHYRELIWMLARRDISVRYKQTLLGALWVILQPLLTMLVFTAVFSKLARIPSEGIPYPLFALSALAIWGFFSRALSQASLSLVTGQALLKKVYYPRLINLVSPLLSNLVDLGFTVLLVGVAMAHYRLMPGWRALAIPGFVLIAAAASFALSLWLSALYVRYRDIGHLVPVLLQLWMYATPVVYPLSKVPREWVGLYTLNPMVGVVEGFRWGLFPGYPAPGLWILPSLAVVAVVLLGGLVFFGRVADTFADVV